MSAIQEIEHAIRQLPPHEFAELRQWLAEFDQTEWDAQISADAAAGRLDAMADRALSHIRERV